MTKFTSIIPKKSDKRTVFYKAVASLEIVKYNNNIEMFTEIIYLGKHKIHGDTFKAIRADGSFEIVFGEKGDEFD